MPSPRFLWLLVFLMAFPTLAHAEKEVKELDELFGPGRRERRGPPPQPKAVQVEQRYVAAAYREVPPLKALPAFLDQAALAAALPLEAHADGVMDEVERQFADGRGETVRGDALDPGGSAYLVVVAYGAFERALLLFDGKGKLGDVWAMPLRGQVFLRDVLGDARAEIVVQAIQGVALSEYPETWTVLAAGDGGRLRALVSVPHSYSSGSKFQGYCFMNHLDFEPRGTLVLETVLFREGCLEYAYDHGDGEKTEKVDGYLPGFPKRQGERVTLQYDAPKGRFVGADADGRELLRKTARWARGTVRRVPPALRGPGGGDRWEAR